MSLLNLSVFFLFVTCLFNSGNSARILGAVFTPSYSHQVTFHPIWRELSLRGHQVTVLTTNPINDPKLKNLTEIDLSMSYDIMQHHNVDEILSSSNDSKVTRFKKYMAALHDVGEAQFAHAQVQELIHNKNEQFDLLMVEVIYPVHMAFAWHFQVPFIGLVSMDALPRTHAAIGNPIHPALYPGYELPFDKNLTFFQILISLIYLCFTTWYGYFVFYPTEDLTVRKFFGDDIPKLEEIEKNMSFLFTNVNPAVSTRPLTPTTIQIGGGLHLSKDPKPLPQDLKQFLDGAKEGFVFFSLGSGIKSSSLSSELKSTILETFRELPFKVLWKFEDDSLENKPDNVKIVDWAPQPSILTHPNIKVFITQCGLQSMEEAIFYKVPMVGLPMVTDQLRNGQNMATRQFGIKLTMSELKKEEFKDAILNVAQNPIYRENLQKYVDLLTDAEMTGLEKAIWWTEYAIRHKGAYHLHSPAVDIPLYKYFMLDVLGFLLIITIISLYTSVKTLKFVIGLCSSKKTQKIKQQ